MCKSPVTKSCGLASELSVTVPRMAAWLGRITLTPVATWPKSVVVKRAGTASAVRKVRTGEGMKRGCPILWTRVQIAQVPRIPG